MPSAPHVDRNPDRPALFLDRDGVVNVERNYVHRREDFVFLEGIFEFCRRAADAGMAIVVVTNQAGIGRGYYSEEQFRELTRWMCDVFETHGVRIDGVYFCPFHPEHGIGRYRAESFDRKPNPGMILRAVKDLGLDVSRSVLVGDKASDIQAARAAGVPTALLLGSANACADSAPDFAAESLAELSAHLFPVEAGR